MDKIGFIGLGIMGLPMATNLIKKTDKEVLGFDIQEIQIEKFKEIGGKNEDTIEDILAKCQVVFLCLPTNNLVEQTIMLAVEKGYSDRIIIDLGSTSPTLIQKLSKVAEMKNINIIDSPVSGGESGAISGNLAIMCGGNKKVFYKVYDLLTCMGQSVTYMGESGCGSAAKVANNMIVGCNIGAVAEAFTFAKKAGIDPDTLYHAIKDGFAGSEVLSSKIPKIISRDFGPSARMAVHQKDLINAVQMAEELGVEIPMSNMVLGYMDEMEEDGKIDEDHCALIKVYEKRMNIEVK